MFLKFSEHFVNFIGQVLCKIKKKQKIGSNNKIKVINQKSHI